LVRERIAFFRSNRVDVTFRTEEGTFNYRVCAVIINDGRLLAMKDGRSPYYYLPGGRVELHETMENAVLRELKEEMKVDATIDRALWLNQNFFVEDVNNEKYHEICLYFLVDIGNSDFPTTKNVIELYEKDRKLTFEWLRLEDMENRYLYPNFIKKEIFRIPNELKIITEYK